MRRIVGAVAAGIAVFAAVVAIQSGTLVIAFEILVLYLGAIFVAAFAARAGGGLPGAGRSTIEQVLAAKPPPEPRVAELERIERLTALGVTHAGDFHVRLRPILREIATPLLAARGVDLERQPERARDLLGDDTWELVRADAPRPADPFSPGVGEARLRAAVDVLERMAR